MDLIDSITLIIEICAMQSMLPLKTAASCALVSRQFNYSVQWYIDKLYRLRAKYKGRFGRALYAKLLKYPFRADSIVTTVHNLIPNSYFGYVNEEDTHPLFRIMLHKKPFTDQFLEKNVVAVANVKLRLVAPIDLRYDLVYMAHKFESKTATMDRFVPVDCGKGVTRYLLDLKLGTRHNFLPSNYIDNGRLYLDLYGGFSGELGENKLIVEYYTMPVDKYNYNNYYPCYDGSDKFIKKYSFIRHQDAECDVGPEPIPPEFYDNLDTMSIHLASTGRL